MSKINVSSVITNHLKTLSDQKGILSISDVFTHFVLPIVLSIFACFYYGLMRQSLASIFVNFGAITTALLMSAVIMIFEQKESVKSKIEDIEEKVKNPSLDPELESKLNKSKVMLQNNKKIYSQLCSNISFSILTSVLLVLFSVVVSFFPDDIRTITSFVFKVIYYILSGSSYFLFLCTVITFLMVIKRFSQIIGD